MRLNHLMPMLAMLAALAASPALAQTDASRIYATACAACHGSDGRGATAAASAYPLVPADFTDCSFATREPDSDWLAVSHDGAFAYVWNQFDGTVSEIELPSVPGASACVAVVESDSGARSEPSFS